MKPIIIYTSKYGSTEKNANWLAEALKCPAKKLKSISSQELAAYDTIIYGGGLYAGGVAGFKKYLSYIGSAKDKKLILFMVGSTNPADKKTYAEVAERNIPAEWKERFQVFALHGDQLFSKMSVLHKLMMRVPKHRMEKVPEAERTGDMKRFLENFGRDVIFTSREQIEPIIEYLQNK